MKLFYRALAVLLVLMVGGYLFVFQYLAKQNPDNQYSKSTIIENLSSETLVFYNDGESLLGSLFDKNHRRYIKYEEIPDELIEAVVAGEDKGFYSHGGYDVLGILRAFIKVATGGPRQGGSTITQQTAKNIFGREKNNISSKVTELIQAIRLEHHFSKQEILEFYLNQFFVVGTGRGVGIAAEYFFDKELKELNPKECAFIAASLKGPFNYDPFGQKDSLRVKKALKKGKHRIEYIFNKMEEQNFITAAQKKERLKLPLRFKKGEFLSSQGILMYAIINELAKEEFQTVLQKEVGEDWQKQGLKITTSIDKSLQKKTEQNLDDHLDTLATFFDSRPQGAVVVLDSNKVLAYVGGYNNRGYNRVAKAKRQFGSTWKTTLVALALKEGYGINELVENEINTFRTNRQFYFPQADHSNKGDQVSLKEALTKSENIASIRLLVSLLKNAPKARLKVLAKKYGLSQKDKESTKEYRKRLSDKWSIPIDGYGNKEIRLNRAKEKVKVDWVLGGRDEALRFLDILELGRGYDRQIKKTKSLKKKHYLTLNYDVLSAVYKKIKANDQSLYAYKLNDQISLSSVKLKEGELLPKEGLEIEDSSSVLINGFFTLGEWEEIESALEQQKKLPDYWWTKDELLDLPDFLVRLSIEHYRQTMYEWGLREAPPAYMSVPLGSIEVTLLEMSQVYSNIFKESLVSQEGKLTLIKKIDDSQNKTLYSVDKHKEDTWRYQSNEAVQNLSLSLKSVVDNGTGKRAKKLKAGVKGKALRFGVGGKTGTTNSYKNTAFIGIIPKVKKGYLDPINNITLGVYVGFDNNKPMVSKKKTFSGSSASLPLWVSVAQDIIDEKMDISTLDHLNLDHQIADEWMWVNQKEE